MVIKRPGTAHGCWAEFRFGVVGHLFSAPPERGRLGDELAALARRNWTHPISGEPTQFHVSTITRWYYEARGNPDNPVAALRPRVRSDRGKHRPHFAEAVWSALFAQYTEHPSWTYQLHADNLHELCRTDAELGLAPSYATVRRHMKGQGWVRRPKRRDDDRPAAQLARAQRAARESRGWEMSHVHALWHLDFKDGPLPVLTRGGERQHPQLFGALDNRSRLGCHLQWYLGEAAEEFCHGLGQATQKRGKPRSVMMDNGPAMKAGETRQGLLDLGIELCAIPDYTPEHNAIIEAFWKQITLRLLPMLEGVPDLTLALLNEATQAWLEHEYHRSVHSETGRRPSSACSMGPAWCVTHPRPMSCAAPSVSKSTASSATPTAPSASAPSASRCPTPIVISTGSPSATPAGICRAPISGTTPSASCSPPFTPSTAKRMPAAFADRSTPPRPLRSAEAQRRRTAAPALHR